MAKSNEELQNELDNLKKVVFRIMDFNGIDADIKHYNFITDDDVRRQLELDFLKMMQTLASNFNEYCQYSFFQIENLLNYYYAIRFRTEEGLTKYFEFYENEKFPVISKISYARKFTKFAKEFLKEGQVDGTKTNKQTINFGIQKIAYVRNLSIHRSTIDIDKYEDDTYKKYLEINKKPKEQRSEEERKIHRRGNEIKFKREQRFLLVNEYTEGFIKVIKIEIEEHQK